MEGRLALPGIGVTPYLPPGSLTGIIPPGLDPLAGKLVHVNAEREPAGQVGDEKASVLSLRRLNMILPIALT
jgi:hypothetical protein